MPPAHPDLQIVCNWDTPEGQDGTVVAERPADAVELKVGEWYWAGEITNGYMRVKYCRLDKLDNGKIVLVPGERLYEFQVV